MIREANIPRFLPVEAETACWDEHGEETAHWVEEAKAAGETSKLSDVLERARRRREERAG
jgi:hypothetical protein